MSSDESVVINAKVRIEHVDSDDVGQRLDNWLIARLKGVPKSKVYNIVRKGEVRVNGKRAKPLQRLVSGDQVRIPPVRVAAVSKVPPASERRLAQLSKAIVYEDDRLIVINKPFGWAVHGGSGVELGVIEALRQLKPDERKLELVHRLDKDTSGLLMISKRRAVLKELHQALQAKKNIEKRYVALVHGRWPNRKRRVDAPLHKYTLPNGERMVRVSQDGKRSQTEYEVVRRFEGYTLLHAWPITGRTHQIRVHCLHAGSPIAGDPKYAHKLEDAMKDTSARLCLHATRLVIKWQNGEISTFDAPIPESIQGFIDTLSEV